MANTESEAGPESANQGDDKKLLEEAQARFRLCQDADEEIRRETLDDLEFAAGNQWPDTIRNERQQDGRPCLTINRLPQHIRQVTNDQRQNRPSIKVHPVDDESDVETAKVYSGLIRHIEYNSNADAAYDTAFDGAVRGGRGFWRILTQYVSPTSFDQEILIKTIRNPLSVFLDPYSKEPDGADANFGFIFEDISKDEFHRQFPKSEMSRSGNWDTLGNAAPGWMTKDSARVAEYFYKDYREATLVQLANGDVLEESEIEQALAQAEQMAEQAQQMGQQAPVQPDLTIVAKRQTKIPVVRWCKINASEILERTDWIGTYIPIVPVYGEVLDIDGKRTLKGIVRDAKDAQRMINFWKSAETEAIALAPRAPFIVAGGQIEGYEAMWQNANRRNFAYLSYKPTSLNGQPVPPPQRQAFEPAVQAITQAAMFAADDLKATTGIFDASLGNQSNETSGIAIQRRNIQAQTSNFHFVDNLTRSLKHTGRILLEIIPKIYDTARTARIIGEDGEQKIVKLNQPTGENGKDGEPIVHDMSVGQYDATVDVGPSYASKRQEAVASMLDLSKAVPAIPQAAGDLIVKAMDWPGAQEISERLKKMLPPNLLDDPTKQQGQVPPQVQQQLQQQGQMIEQMTKQLHEAHDVIDNKRVEIESRERIEMAKLETTATIELAKLESKEALNMLAHQIAELDARTQLLGMGQPFPQETQDFAPETQGAPGAEMGNAGMNPTGGASPGLPMEGMPHP